MDCEHSSHSNVLMMEQTFTSSFMGRRSFVPRPLSAATEFLDTDSEREDDNSSSPLSAESLDGDSQTTVSNSDGLRTPSSAGLGAYEFHFDDKPVKGPTGPHLFRIPTDALGNEAFQDPESYLKYSSTLERSLSSRPRPAQLSSPCRPFSSLNSAVAELDDTQVRSWSPRQVAKWMFDAGFESNVVNKFLAHDISGSVLLDLQFEDLKELDITSFGKRHRVMSTIHHLRNSSTLSVEAPPPLDLERCASQRRGRHHRQKVSDDLLSIAPGESVSIVAIEQLLPKPHKCAKGEDCSKWQRQQLKLQKLRQEFPLESRLDESPLEAEASASLPPTSPNSTGPKSDAAPSVVASSAVFGPSQIPKFSITPEKLNEVTPRDPQENVRQYLTFQHVRSSSPAHGTRTPSPQQAIPLTEHLRHLPKLTIPTSTAELLPPSTSRESRSYTPGVGLRGNKTPISAIKHTSQLQLQMQNSPYNYGNSASPGGLYLLSSPFSETDIPVTAFPVDPLARDESQSVPPDMRYGAIAAPAYSDPIRRPSSTNTIPHKPHRRQQSFTPSIAPLQELAPTGRQPNLGSYSAPPPLPVPITDTDAQHSGWMRKRKTTKFLRHEWQDHHFTLTGTRLAMYKDDSALKGSALESIDVDDYAVACSSIVASSKLSAAFKRSILGSKSATAAPSTENAFAFSLVPSTEAKKIFSPSGSKAHHFSVNTRDERIDWMRELMLAKALKRGKSMGNEVRVNGNLI